MLGGFEDFSLKKQVVDEGYDLRHAVYLVIRCTMRGSQQATLVAGFFFDADAFVRHVAGTPFHAIVDAEKAS
jgi:hypothetical protein